ncbi:MAG TPA: hypothetical protein VN025_15210 [Candidatus Dormibacteraeota bacterium]|nr:hypothetical protein [Candidatus Dormibacteraeota bacterium]
MLFVTRVRVLVGVAMLSIAITPRAAKPQDLIIENGSVPSKRAKAAKREEILQKVRAQVLTILQTENGCSAWYREADPDAAGVFESLFIQIGKESRGHVIRSTDGTGHHSFKHPWGARSNQLTGRNAVVEINPNGPFFVSYLPVIAVGPNGTLFRYEGYRNLTVGSFPGDKTEAQATILLHELGHVIGRIPEDDDSWDGRSSRNTEEVLRNCRSEIQELGQKSSQRGN